MYPRNPTHPRPARLAFRAIAMALACAGGAAAAATFTVTHNQDSGNGSLRGAITLANALPGPDRIEFAIPVGQSTVINVPSPLPGVADAVEIDGYTQPGARPNALALGTDAQVLIRLAGPGSGTGLKLESGDVTIRGLAIGGFRQGIANFVNGLENIVIEGNFIGVDSNGTGARPNLDFGISLARSQARIGGASLAARNLISFNGNSLALTGQIELFEPTPGTLVLGNLIGTAASGMAGLSLPGDGIVVEASNLTLGSPTAPNRIGFVDNGIVVVGDSPAGDRFHDNDFLQIRELAVDLAGDGPNANDPDDLDTGPNNLQNFPALTLVHAQAGQLQVQGSLDVAGILPASYTIALYLSQDCAPGSRGEGLLLGTANVQLRDASEQFAFALPGPPTPGLFVSATATRAAVTGANGDTSEFSECIAVTGAGEAVFAHGFEQ